MPRLNDELLSIQAREEAFEREYGTDENDREHLVGCTAGHDPSRGCICEWIEAEASR